MAEIAPFRGLCYDPARVELSRVLAPPYDVIDDQERAELAAKDPYNCVRLILPEGEGDSKYAAAAQLLRAWHDQGMLQRDQRPGVYRYHQIFTSRELGRRTVTRRGFIAAVRLHAYDEGVVLPHERTMRGPKIDRLKLWEATAAHLSQVFTIYSDPSGQTDALFDSAERREPALDGTTDDGTRHLVWRVTDRDLIGALARLMAAHKLYIADGHHRYETMLAYRDRLRERAGGSLPAKSAAQFGTLFLANMDDKGLVVLPTHRLLHDLPDFDIDRALAGARHYFDIQPLAGAAAAAAELRQALEQSAAPRPSFAAVVPGRTEAYLLSRKASVNPAELGPPALTDLDVTLLHDLFLDKVLGIDREAQAAKRNLSYIKDTDEILRRIHAGEGQMAFILRATPLRQVCAVAEAGETMPQKSTFFYPKLASGLVFAPIVPSEELA